MWQPRTLVLTFALLIAALGPRALHGEVTIERLPDRAVVRLDGKPFTEYRLLLGAKPILWPILGPTGKPMTRAYPMQKVAGEKQDHVHQRSMWFTHGSVNGVDFWGEEPRHGTTKHRDFVKTEGGKTGLLDHPRRLARPGRKEDLRRRSACCNSAAMPTCDGSISSSPSWPRRAMWSSATRRRAASASASRSR